MRHGNAGNQPPDDVWLCWIAGNLGFFKMGFLTIGNPENGWFITKLLISDELGGSPILRNHQDDKTSLLPQDGRVPLLGSYNLDTVPPWTARVKLEVPLGMTHLVDPGFFIDGRIHAILQVHTDSMQAATVNTIGFRNSCNYSRQPSKGNITTTIIVNIMVAIIIFITIAVINQFL